MTRFLTTASRRFGVQDSDVHAALRALDKCPSEHLARSAVQPNGVLTGQLRNAAGRSRCSSALMLRAGSVLTHALSSSVRQRRTTRCSECGLSPSGLGRRRTRGFQGTNSLGTHDCCCGEADQPSSLSRHGLRPFRRSPDLLFLRPRSGGRLRLRRETERPALLLRQRTRRSKPSLGLALASAEESSGRRHRRRSKLASTVPKLVSALSRTDSRNGPRDSSINLP